jgi:hypothetical protein
MAQFMEVVERVRARHFNASRVAIDGPGPGGQNFARCLLRAAARTGDDEAISLVSQYPHTTLIPAANEMKADSTFVMRKGGSR